MSLRAVPGGPRPAASTACCEQGQANQSDTVADVDRAALRVEAASLTESALTKSAPTEPALTEAALTEAALTEAEAEAHVRGICFKTGPPGRVGVELEWLVRDRSDPAAPVASDRVAAALASLSGITCNGITRDGEHLTGEALTTASGARITVEPGGQLELSSAPAAQLGDLVDITLAELAALRDALAEVGLELCGYGLDPLRLPHRLVNLPRYAAMERFFDRDGPWGREMMCGTASVQVCVDAGEEADGLSSYQSRWRLLHTIGPVLVAAFANSPLRGGRPCGWRSARQQVWAHLDPGRTKAPATAGDPRAAWARYAIDASVMCVRDPASADWSAPAGLTFRDWLRGDARLRPPTTDDLDYHLSTLFPPVRPRGHLELRMIDAQPGNGWIVPAAVVTALTEDTKAADTALAAAEPVWSGPDPWLRAARHGPADQQLSLASRECFAAADAALCRIGVPGEIRQAVADFAERYVLRDRCPADDQLEEGT
jgi:ergothioneine biosynthesis glutamate--cysteine ligase EgtA